VDHRPEEALHPGDEPTPGNHPRVDEAVDALARDLAHLPGHGVGRRLAGVGEDDHVGLVGVEAAPGRDHDPDRRAVDVVEPPVEQGDREAPASREPAVQPPGLRPPRGDDPGPRRRE
jgi:hypothetical protein